MTMSRFPGNPQPESAGTDAYVSPPEGARRNILQVLWLRRWIIAVTTVLSIIAGVAYWASAIRIYRAAATVYVQQSAPKMFLDAAGGFAGNANYLNTQTALIRSRQLLERAINMPGIRDLAIFRREGMTDPVGFLSGSIGAAVGRRDDVITISMESTNAEEAAKIVNAVVQAFRDYHASQREQSAQTLLEMIRRQKDVLDLDIQKRYQERLAFQRANATLSIGTGQTSAIIERLNQLSGALTAAQMQALEAESTYKSTADIINDPVKIAQLMSSPQFRGGENVALRRELRDLQQQYLQLSERYLQGFAGLEALQNRVKQMQEALAEEDRRAAEAFLAELKVRWEAAEKRQLRIQEYVAEQQKQVLEYNQRAADFAIIEADIRRLERNSDSLDEQLKAIDLGKDAGSFTVGVIDLARPEHRIVSPDSGKVMAMSLLGGLLLGVALAYLREMTDHRLRSAEEIKTTLSLPILGVVPHIQNAKTPSHRGLVLHRDPMSDAAEAYRTIRTAVYFGQPNGVAKTLLVTSPAPGDGKSTLASNLGIAMAQAGNRILILDCDFRKPTQHRIFELDKKIGLSNVLAGEMTLEQAICETPVAGLHVLPCGPIPANPSEILNSQTFADLLDELCEKYDHVLIDSPPVMPVTDSRILAASCDATVLALRAEKSTRKGAVYARDVLNSVGARLIGVVVNDVPRRRGVYGYYYSDAELYSYGYGAKRVSANGRKAAAEPAAEEPKQLA